MLININQNKKALLSMTTVSLIWGVAPIIMKNTILGIGPALYSLARFSIAVFFLKIILLVIKKNFLYKDKFKLILMGACLITPYSFLFLLGIQYTSSAEAAMINSTASVWTVVIIYLTTNKLPAIYSLLGIIISILGLGIFIFNDLNKINLFYTKTNLLGNFIIFLSTLCFAYYSFLLKSFEKLGFTSLHIAYYTFLGATFSIIPIFLSTEFNFYIWTDITLINGLGIIYMAIFASVISYILYAYNVNILGAHKAILVLNFVPIISISFSTLLTKEDITIRHFIASIILTFGSFLVFYKKL